MANATEHPVGRSRGHEWAVFMATSGHFCWPPVGTNYWPLTSLQGMHAAKPPEVVWINGTDGSGNPVPGAIESMLMTFDEDMCLAACQTIQPGLSGDTMRQMKKLKGSSGTFLARALIDRHADWHSWPTPLRELIQKIDVAI